MPDLCFLSQRNKQSKYRVINRGMEQGHNMGSCNGIPLDTFTDSPLYNRGKISIYIFLNAYSKQK